MREMPAPDGNGDYEEDDNPESWPSSEPSKLNGHAWLRKPTPIQRAMFFPSLQPEVDNGFWLLSHQSSHSTLNMSKKIPKYQSTNDSLDPYKSFICGVLLLRAPEVSLVGRLEI